MIESAWDTTAATAAAHRQRSDVAGASVVARETAEGEHRRSRLVVAPLHSKSFATPRVVHATDCLAGGVLSALAALLNQQVETGYTVTLLYARRDDTPSALQLSEIFPRVHLIETSTSLSRARGAASLARALGRIARDERIHVIHLHSTVAGLAGRLAVLVRHNRRKIVFSPHGWSFLRTSQPRWERLLLRLIESFVQIGTGGVIVVSDGERAVTPVDQGKTRVLENAVDVSLIPSRIQSSSARYVATVGRVTYQKAPWRFNMLADRLYGEGISCSWIGGGDEESTSKWLGSPNVTVTGWMSRSEVLEKLASASIFVLASLWEGMPMSLIEAQLIGLPCVVSDVVGNADVILDGVTGFVCKTDEELVDKVKLLLKDDELAQRFSTAARYSALQRFGASNYAFRCSEVYADLVGRRIKTAVQAEASPWSALVSERPTGTLTSRRAAAASRSGS